MKIRLPVSLLLALFFLPFGPGSGFSWQAHSAQAYSADHIPDGYDPQSSPAVFSTAQSGCGGETVQATNDDYEQRVVELVNEIRTELNLPPLKHTSGLDQAARYHAADLGTDDYFDHDTFDRVAGALVEICDTWSRISKYYSGASGENIAAGYTSPEAVVEGWMNSPGHKANILNPDSWEIGVGYYAGEGTFPEYWVQDFGKRSGVYPLVINGEAAITESQNVSLYIYGSWESIRLRNNTGVWTAWQPFTSSPDWSLDGSSGEQTVHVELSNGNEIVASSDTIHLLAQDASLPALGDLPETLQFTFSIPEQRIIPAFYQLTPGLANGAGTLSWSVQSDGNFFTATPPQGETPETLTIMPVSFDLGSPGTYEGSLTIFVDNPAGVVGAPHTIEVTLEVVETKIFQNFLPGIQN